MEREIIISEIKNILLYYKIEECYLFGSFARNDYNKFSDIDLAIKCENLDIYFNIIEDLNNINTMRKFDIHNISYTDFSFNFEEVKKYAIKLC